MGRVVRRLFAQIAGECEIGIVIGKPSGNKLAVALDDDSPAAREIVDYRSGSVSAERGIQTPSRG